MKRRDERASDSLALAMPRVNFRVFHRARARARSPILSIFSPAFCRTRPTGSQRSSSRTRYNHGLCRNGEYLLLQRDEEGGGGGGKEGEFRRCSCT